mmetsp:Transcript_28779/g.70191  ORF Transcript_28779/g.70191 Transcript_28779/m.70191 type:complete len:230 (+) Transcript_28779:1583-2272(+)
MDRDAYQRVYLSSPRDKKASAVRACAAHSLSRKKYRLLWKRGKQKPPNAISNIPAIPFATDVDLLSCNIHFSNPFHGNGSFLRTGIYLTGVDHAFFIFFSISHFNDSIGCGFKRDPLALPRLCVRIQPLPLKVFGGRRDSVQGGLHLLVVRRRLLGKRPAVLPTPRLVLRRTLWYSVHDQLASVERDEVSLRHLDCIGRAVLEQERELDLPRIREAGHLRPFAAQEPPP